MLQHTVQGPLEQQSRSAQANSSAVLEGRTGADFSSWVAAFLTLC